MFKATLLVAVFVWFSVGLAVTPQAAAIPEPVEFYSCFAGGTSIVVLGRPVATCFLGPGGSPVGFTYCDNGQRYTVFGISTRCVGG